MSMTPSIDSQIDELYKAPLEEFVSKRTELARSLSGAEARDVKALRKPTVVPWVVNQLYWRARAAYDRLRSSGAQLRAAQIAALKGKSADIRAATDAHRKAAAAAVTEALRLASAAGAHPDADELSKTLEAVSLAAELPEPPGRLTKALRPAGFEALAGVPVKAAPLRLAPSAAPAKDHARQQTAEEERTRQEEQRRKKEERAREKAIERAAAAVGRAKTNEAQARAAWERTRDALAAAEQELWALKRRT